MAPSGVEYAFRTPPTIIRAAFRKGDCRDKAVSCYLRTNLTPKGRSNSGRPPLPVVYTLQCVTDASGPSMEQRKDRRLKVLGMMKRRR